VFAVGVGLATAIFALADPYTLRPLPYGDEARLVRLTADFTRITDTTRLRLQDLRDRQDLFDDVAAYDAEFRSLEVSGETLRARTLQVTPNFLAVLGVPGPPEDRFLPPEGDREVPFVPTGLGAGEFGSLQPGERLGDGEAFLRVVSTLPEAFRIPDPEHDGRSAGLTPFSPEVVAERIGYSVRAIRMIGRLKTGVTVDQARAALLTLSPDVPGLLEVEPVRELMTGAVRPLATGALAGGLLILLICAVNVAGLLVARAAWRERELATRTALGATRFDLGRLWLVELGLLSGVALLMALGLAAAVLVAVRSVIPQAYVSLGSPELTARVVGFAMMAGCAVLGAGLAGAQATTSWIARVRHDGSPWLNRRISFVRLGLAAGQAAFAMVLAIGAAMMIQTYATLMLQDVGYDRSTIAMSVRSSRPSAERTEQARAVLDSLRRVPGVLAAGASTVVVNEKTSWTRFLVAGAEEEIHVRGVTPDFFAAAGLSIVEGRALTTDDRPGEVVVVNEAFSRQLLGTASVGQTFSDSRGATSRIVGVVTDAFDLDLVTPPEPRIYAGFGYNNQTAEYAVRVDGAPDALIDALREAILVVDPAARIESADTIGSRLAETVRDRTFASLILTVFGVAATLVTVAGLVSMVTFAVAWRAREIAIRLAIGATGGNISRLVVHEATVAAVLGSAVGLLAGRWLSTYLESLVYGVDAGSWHTALAAAGLMLTIMVGSAIVPALQLSRAPSAEILRSE